MFAVFVIAALSSACRSAGGNPTAAEAVVYVAAPLSGVRADAGQSALGGVQLAAEEINGGGGLLGHRLVVRALDDRSESSAALAIVDNIGRAIERGERIAGVIGHMDGGPTSSALPYYEEMGLVVITPSAGLRALTHRGHEFVFRVNATDKVQAELSARFLAEELNATRVAVVQVGTDYGSDMAASLADSLRKFGATTALQVVVEEGRRDFSETALQVLDAEVDAVYFAGAASEAAYLNASLIAAGADLPVLASDGAFQAAAIDEAAGASEGMYVSALAPSPNRAADEDWIEAYRKIARRDPGPFSLNGYVAMQVLAASVRTANSFEGDAIAQAIRVSEIETLFGPTRFSANGDRADARVWIYRVEEGEFRQID